MKKLAGIIFLGILMVSVSGYCSETAPGNTARADYVKIGFDVMKNEVIGFLKIGLLDSDVLAGLGEPEDKSPMRVWGADGLEHQKWFYPTKGIELDMKSREGAFVINMIRINNPCDYKTKQDIGIGSSIKEIHSAYNNKLNPESSDSKLVVGTVYGGIIFGMNAGTVSSIFIGAAAE